MEVDLYGINIGMLKIPSGYLIACDPGHIEEYGIPFTQQFPTGEFPVHLSVARLNDEETIAFARIKFNNNDVQRWELALKKGESPVAVGAEKIHGYSTDYSVGIFIDNASARALDKQSLARNDAPLFSEMDKHYHNDWRYALYNFNDHNLAAFSSGFGDGFYASYIGFDEKGAPCRLVTDFRVFDWDMK